MKIRLILQIWFQPIVAKLPIVKLKKKDALKLLKSVFSWMSDEINSLCLSSIYSMYKQLWIFWHSHAFWRHLRISSKKPLEIGYSTDSTFIHLVYISHGLLNRWTDIFILPRTAWGGPFNLYNITQTHSIFVKLLENTFLGMPKVRAWSIFTLSMS